MYYGCFLGFFLRLTEYWLSLMFLSYTLFLEKCHSPEIGLTAFLLNFNIQMDGIERTQILLIFFKAFQEMRLIIAWAICYSYFISPGVGHTIKLRKMLVYRPFLVIQDWNLIVYAFILLLATCISPSPSFQHYSDICMLLLP